MRGKRLYTEGRNIVSGRIVDHGGEPVTKIFADLVPIEQMNERYRRDARVTEVNEKGEFKFAFVPPGSYYLGVRLRSSSLKHSFPRTFYPGTQVLDSAAVIVIREGQVLTGLDFQLPKKLTERKAEGLVVFPDGKPVANARILVEEGELRHDAPGAESDANGRFTLTLLEGLTYRIRAYVNLGSGEQRHAHAVTVEKSGPVEALKIVISEPNGNCPRCRP